MIILSLGMILHACYHNYDHVTVSLHLFYKTVVRGLNKYNE